MFTRGIDWYYKSNILPSSVLYDYPNWGGLTVCIKGKDNNNNVILFNEQAVFEKARTEFDTLLGATDNQVATVPTADIIKKLSYDDWGYEKELTDGNFSLSGNPKDNWSVKKKFGCSVWEKNDISDWNKNCYPGREGTGER